MPRETDARLEAHLIGTHQRAGVGLPAERTDRRVADDRGSGAETVDEVEIHQPSVALADRRVVLPASAAVERETGAHAPIVGEVAIPRIGPQVLVGVTERDRAGGGGAEEEIGEVVAGRIAGEGELS